MEDACYACVAFNIVKFHNDFMYAGAIHVASCVSMGRNGVVGGDSGCFD